MVSTNHRRKPGRCLLFLSAEGVLGESNLVTRMPSFAPFEDLKSTMSPGRTSARRICSASSGVFTQVASLPQEPSR